MYEYRLCIILRVLLEKDSNISKFSVFIIFLLRIITESDANFSNFFIKCYNFEHFYLYKQIRNREYAANT